MSESQKPYSDPNATMQLDAVDEVLLDESAQAAAAAKAPAREAAPRIAVPKMQLDVDDPDANTTIWHDGLDPSHREELEKRLFGERQKDDYDPNNTLEFERMRALDVRDLERVLKAARDEGADENATVRIDAIDDGKLEELEAVLAEEKRTKGIRKMSHLVHGDAQARRPSTAIVPGAGSRGAPRDDDEEMFTALGRDLAAAWGTVVAVVKRFAARVRVAILGAPSAPIATRPSRSKRVARPDDTVPPASARARRSRGGWFKTR